MVEHRRDPRRRLSPRPRVVARGIARRARSPALLADDDRRAVPRPGARVAAPLRRRPLRGRLLLGDRRQDRVAVRDVVSDRRHGEQRRPSPRSTRSPASAITSACASRSSTTCSTSRPPTTSSAKPSGQDLRRGDLHAAGHLMRSPSRPELREPARPSARLTIDSPTLASWRRQRAACPPRSVWHATTPPKAGEALAGADGSTPDVTDGLHRLVEGLVTRDA